MDQLKSSGKPFEISKWEVWEAYRQVKANQGAPGVDRVTIKEFETDLKNNLYRIWNRMSSGSYFPPPVKAVEIPKSHGGGVRVLGVPTVADRIAQTVAARRLEAKVEPIFHPDSYGYRPGRSALDAVAACRRRCWMRDWVIDLDVQAFYQDVRDNLRVKEVRLDQQPGVRWIICHNPEQAVKDKTDRDRQLEAVRTELERITALRAKVTPAKDKSNGKGEGQGEGSEPAAHVKAECALRNHKALGRWVRQTPSGRLILNTAKVAAEERLDGKYLLCTSDPSLPAGEVALGYKNLLEAERSFRDMKSTLALRPVYHRLQPRIRAHVLLCWLALLLVRVAERRTSMTWATINRQLGRVHAVTLTGTAGTVVHTTPMTTAQAGIVTACGLPQPPAVTALDPS